MKATTVPILAHSVGNIAQSSRLRRNFSQVPVALYQSLSKRGVIQRRAVCRGFERISISFVIVSFVL